MAPVMKSATLSLRPYGHPYSIDQYLCYEEIYIAHGFDLCLEPPPITATYDFNRNTVTYEQPVQHVHTIGAQIAADTVSDICPFRALAEIHRLKETHPWTRRRW